MFNLQPGQGLGFSGSKEIALGLGGIVPAISAPPVYHGGGGFGYYEEDWKVKRDREILEDDEILFEIICAITPTLH